jgi:hypothetical protein
MNECMNKKNEKFCEPWHKNHEKWSSGWKIWALEDFKGKTVFSGGSSGICGIFE